MRDEFDNDRCDIAYCATDRVYGQLGVLLQEYDDGTDDCEDAFWIDRGINFDFHGFL